MFTIDLEKMARILKMAEEIDIDKLEKRLKFNKELTEYNHDFFKFNLRMIRTFLEYQKNHPEQKIMNMEDVEYMLKKADEFNNKIIELYRDAITKEKI